MKKITPVADSAALPSLLSALLPCLLSACASSPPPEPGLDLPVAEAWSTESAEPTLSAPPEDAWWTTFGSGDLDRLVDELDLPDQMRSRGFRQVLRFSWERAARETFRFYESCVG